MVRGATPTIVRGSTPTRTIRVKDKSGEFIDFSAATGISVTYKQDDLIELTKDLTDGVSINSEGHIVVKLTADDTMRLFPGIAKMQVEADFGGNVLLSDGDDKIQIINRLKSGD